MNKLAAYIETKSEIESLRKRLEALESDETLKQTLKFQDKLEKLMNEFNVSQEDVLKMWGKKSETKAKSGSDKRRGTRPLKTFKNPKTGETVKTRGGNHKTLNAWRKEFGKETVDSWLVTK